VDLIIIATHGHTGVEHILFGSTAEKVVRKAPCPVLTLRDPIKGFVFKEAFKKKKEKED
jgi:nucleotide-binding universal stress UspA family protein